MNEQDKVERVSKMIAVAESKLKSVATSGLGEVCSHYPPAERPGFLTFVVTRRE